MTETTRKPLSWFKTAQNIRENLGDEIELRNLGESMRTGQISPVGAFLDGEMFYGFRRLRAAILARLEYLLVTVYEKRLTESDIKCVQWAENIHRLDMSFYERWKACEALRQLNRSWTGKELAAYLNIEPPAITKLMSPSKCIPEWQEALKMNLVGISDCYQASLISPEQQLALLRLKQTGASRDTLARAIQKSKPKQADGTKRAARIAVPLRSGVKFVVSGKSLSLSELVDSITEFLEAAKKGVREKLDAKTWQSVMRDKAKATAGGENHE